MKSFYEDYRFGSADWATWHEAYECGLFDNPGPVLGYMDGKLLMLDGDAPMITIGGAGSGNLRP